MDRRPNPALFGLLSTLCLIAYILLEPLRWPAGLLVIGVFVFGLIEGFLRLRQ